VVCRGLGRIRIFRNVVTAKTCVSTAMIPTQRASVTPIWGGHASIYRLFEDMADMVQKHLVEALGPSLVDFMADSTGTHFPNSPKILETVGYNAMTVDSMIAFLEES
jgi:hypothetical protein